MNQSSEYLHRAEYWKKSADVQMKEAATCYAFGYDEQARAVLKNVRYCLRKSTAWRVMGEALAGVAR